jgi:hypothetical protein
VERMPDSAQPNMNYEQPYNMGDITGVCFDLADLHKKYVNKLVSEGKMRANRE